MGVQGSKEEKKDYLKDYLKKFDTDEVEVLKKVYRALSARSPGPGIDKETFLQYFPLPGLWGERLFQRFDFKGMGAVDFEEFLIGIAVCCRGTKTDKIHVLFQVFDLNNDGFIQKSELVAMLSNLPNLTRYIEFDGDTLNIVKLRPGASSSSTSSPASGRPRDSPSSLPISNPSSSTLLPPPCGPPVTSSSSASSIPPRPLDTTTPNLHGSCPTFSACASLAMDLPSSSAATSDSNSPVRPPPEKGIFPEDPKLSYQPATHSGGNARISLSPSSTALSEEKREDREEAREEEDDYEEDDDEDEDDDEADGRSTCMSHGIDLSEKTVAGIESISSGSRGGGGMGFSGAADGVKTPPISSVSAILKVSEKLKERQALRQRNPSTIAQSLIDKEKEEESTEKDVDVEGIVDKIIEECEFFEHGELSFLEFKMWLERQDGILMMFTECLHEEVWGLQGNALYRTAAIRPSSSPALETSLEGSMDSLTPRRRALRAAGTGIVGGGRSPRRSGKAKCTTNEIRSDQFYKVKRLFTREAGMYSTSGNGNGGGGGGSLPISSILRKSTSTAPSSAGSKPSRSSGAAKTATSCGSGSAETADELDLNLQIYPQLSGDIVSAELVEYIQASVVNLEVPPTWKTPSSRGRRTERGTNDGGGVKELYNCPNCKAPFFMCPRCSRRYPTLKLIDGRVLLECSLCLEAKPYEFRSCWRCSWEFVKCSDLLIKSEPSQDGVLYKIGKHLHQWRARYYVLIDNLLYYYNKKEDCKPRGFMFLEACYVEKLPDEQNGKFGFSICHSGEKFSRRDLFAATAAERTEWMTALRGSMKQQSLAELYQVCEQLGQGKFSVVYRAIHLPTGTEYAIKVIDKGKITGHERELLRSEMAILRLLQNPHVIYLKEMLDTKETLYIVMELVKGGELYDLLHHRHRLPELHVNSIIRQLLATVAYLHKCGIIHRDLKPENILLTDKTPDAIIKLTDFGLSTLCGPNEKLTQPCGTLAYVAPEVLTLEGYDHKVDVWSIGVIMYLLLRGRLPFPINRNMANPMIRKSRKLSFDGSIWKEISSSARDLITMLLNPTPAQRISVEDAQRHIWIQNPTAAISEASPEWLRDSDAGEPDTSHLVRLNDVSASTFIIPKVPLKVVQAPLPTPLPHVNHSTAAVISTIASDGKSVMVAHGPPTTTPASCYHSTLSTSTSASSSLFSGSRTTFSSSHESCSSHSVPCAVSSAIISASCLSSKSA